MQLNGKRLLVLGGTSASLDIVKNARQMGVYTIATDDQPYGVAKEAADEAAFVSTTDFDGLSALIKEKHIDGVFCGPSEFNIRNLLILCEREGLPCYTNTAIWNRCANKDEFKAYCRQYGVDTPEEYTITADTTDEELDRIDYPIILKPVDGCSSKGISVCRNKEDVRRAYKVAMDASTCKRIVAEKFIENDGELFGVRYLLRDGEAVPYFIMDTYVTDPTGETTPISAFTYAPSKYAAYYMEHMDQNVRRMLKGMGLRNGTAFFQSLPYKGKIYFHEMGYRLSGGMLFKLTEPMVGVNDMKLMIRYALGEPMYTDDEVKNIDLMHMKGVGAQLMLPLTVGTIGKIEGLDAVLALPCVTDFIQYYHAGDTLKPEHMGTLSQHFGRLSLLADREEEILDAVRFVNDTLVVTDTDGKRMNVMLFDPQRTKR
ncbi:MAG: ATP-grasp domain-containing protein [Clostridia bacterium]|nr:ATP-grasp domain-containing protein [Clostridia bacterium]